MATSDHMTHLRAIALEDVAHLEIKEHSYGSSWKKRGGIGAYMMIVRKIDRIENMLARETMIINRSRQGKDNLMRERWDIFANIEEDPSGDDSTVLAEVRDLRRYLLLVEAEMVARGTVSLPVPKRTIEIMEQGTPEDGGQHARQERYEDGLREPPPWPYIVAHDLDGEDYYLTNRRLLPAEDWEHLPRLPVELTYKEWTDTLPEYRPLYIWDESREKYLMLAHRREHWGREP